jgi:hypothetical protein
MYLIRKVFTFTTIFLPPFTGTASDTVSLPSTSDGIYSRVPRMEVGKVKRISKDQLPSDLREATETDIGKSKRDYEAAPEAYFEFTNNYYNNLRTGPKALSNVQVSLVDVSSTKLAEYEYEGFIPEGPTKKGPWTNVTRVFRRPDGMVIKLSEWDFVADGGAIVIVDELMNSNVADIPAYLSVIQSHQVKLLPF